MLSLMLKRFVVVLLTGLVVLGVKADLLTSLADTPEFLPQDQAFKFEYDVIAPGKIEVFWTIADGYYLYKNKLEFAASNAELTEVNLPEGKSHHDEFFGETEVYYHQAAIPISYQSNGAASLVITYMGCAEAGLCYPPTKQKITLPATASAPVDMQAPSPQGKAVSQPASQSELAEQLASNSRIATLALFFLLGLGLAFTPCVFPMYPILSGVIAGNQQRTKSQAFALSLAYVQGMALTYTLLGLLVASFGLQLQTAFQHPVVLISLSVLFAGLALSMFGVFNLQLPSSWQDALQSKSQNIQGGRYGSVFVLGIIAGLVASPCTTAPLSAALLYVGQSGNLWFGGVSLYVLALGMGLPLLIVGTLGAGLLPRSGNWMNTIKHLLGFVTLAVPIFLLERLLPESISLLLWGALLLLSAGYLFFALRSVNHKLMGPLAYTLAGLMMYGGAELAKQSLWPATPAVAQSKNQAELAFVHVNDLRQLKTELAKAQQAGQPVLLDFYADWCIACKEFDKYTFTNTAVQHHLADFVLLRVDVTASSQQDVELLEHYHILGLPSLLLFTKEGQELSQSRIAGFLKPDAFMAHLEQAFASR